VSLGFGHGMNGVDMIVGSYSGSMAQAKDYRSSGEITPDLDKEQDVYLVTTESSRGLGTIICMDRKLNTGDSQD
jgi:hypothetical protein